MSKWVRNEIIVQWNKIAPSICKELDIPVPKLVIEDSQSNLLGLCQYGIERTIFGQIVRIDKVHHITLFAGTLDRMTKLVSSGARKKIGTLMIKQVILHELRHAYQVDHNGQILLDDLDTRKYSFGLLKEADLPSEIDADDYAISKATDKEELMVYKAMTNAHGRKGNELMKMLAKLFVKHTLPKVAALGFLAVKLLKK